MRIPETASQQSDAAGLPLIHRVVLAPGVAFFTGLARSGRVWSAALHARNVGVGSRVVSLRLSWSPSSVQVVQVGERLATCRAVACNANFPTLPGSDQPAGPTPIYRRSGGHAAR